MALNAQDKRDIENIARKEIKSFLDTTQAHTTVLKMVQKELGNKKVDDAMVDIATKVVVELFKTLWQRKSFWESALKNIRP